MTLPVPKTGQEGFVWKVLLQLVSPMLVLYQHGKPGHPVTELGHQGMPAWFGMGGTLETIPEFQTLCPSTGHLPEPHSHLPAFHTGPFWGFNDFC